MVATSEFHPEMKSQPSEGNLRTHGFDQQSHLEYRNWPFHAEDSLKIAESWIPNFQTKILDILGICSHSPPTETWGTHGRSCRWQVAIRRRRQITAVDEAHNATPGRHLSRIHAIYNQFMEGSDNGGPIIPSSISSSWITTKLGVAIF